MIFLLVKSYSTVNSALSLCHTQHVFIVKMFIIMILRQSCQMDRNQTSQIWSKFCMLVFAQNFNLVVSEYIKAQLRLFAPSESNYI